MGAGGSGVVALAGGVSGMPGVSFPVSKIIARPLGGD